MTYDFTKTVDIKAVNDDDMTATGVVMTPNELDRQLDFIDAEGIRRMHTDTPDDGVMHTSFPDGHASLELNKVLDEPETIDGVAFDAGEWVIRRKYENRQRWNLVKDGVLGGYSIGGSITDAETYDSVADLPDEVDTSQVDPDAVPDEHRPPAKLFGGTVREVSDVDRPAVPSAQMAVVKQDLGKNIFEQVDGREEFVALMSDRGHSRKEASRLWRYMSRTKAVDTEKPIVLPNGAEFEDFDDCVASVAGDGTTEEEARAICGSGREQNKVSVNGTEIDLTPPAGMVSAAEAAAEAGSAGLIPSSCGTGVGNDRRDQIRDGELSPEVVRAIASYLVSHEGDVTAEGAPSTWPDDAWSDGCGNAQYAKWGGSGADVSANMEWAMRRVNEIDAARDDPLTYPEIQTNDMTTEKADFETGDWVTWEQASGDTRGQVVDIEETEGESFPDAVSGDANIPQATEDDPVYLIEVGDGFGDDFEFREESGGRGDTLHAVHLESRMTDVSDPREREAVAAGLLTRAKRLLTGADDADGAEDRGGDTAKAGRTLSQRNRRAVMASVDAQLEMLDDAGVDHGMTRFTDRADFAFDIAEYGASEHYDDEDGEKTKGGDPEGDNTSMTESEKSDPPAWATSLTDKVESIDMRVSEMEGDDAE